MKFVHYFGQFQFIYILRFQKIQSLIKGAYLCIIITERHIAQNGILFHKDWL